MPDPLTTPEPTSTILTEGQSAPTDASQEPASPSSTTANSETTEKPDGDAAVETGDGKAADEQANGEGKEGDKPADNAALFGAPEGDYEVTLPEGQPLDAEALAAVSPLFKELGLSNEGASKLVSAYAETVLPRVTEQVMAGVNADVAATQKAWADESRAAVADDAKLEPGARAFDGKPLAQVQSVAAKALDKLGSPEFREFLNETGLGNHPQMLRFAYRAGSAISEDTSFDRGGPAAAPATREEKFYGSKS